MKAWRLRGMALLLVGLAATQASAREPRIWDLAQGSDQEAVVLHVQPLFRKKGLLGILQAEKMFVDQVDDRKPKLNLIGTNLFDQVRVLPGKHRVVLRVIGKGGVGLADLWFVAEPGKEYTARYETQYYLRFRAWIEDAATGELVGGATGSEDEPAT